MEQIDLLERVAQTMFWRGHLESEIEERLGIELVVDRGVCYIIG